ncbi:MAG: hypothetical protein E6G54_01865 [Actinobacteria bacterium]|nr:MAG: hypothetical protein E6G54_01865 [Actinomycetota bacterium]
MAVLTGCSRGSPASPVSTSDRTTSPGRAWLAVLDAAEDPNELDTRYADLVGALDEASVTHVVVSPSACYSGLPSRYDGRYVLGVWGATEHAVRALLDSAGAREGWIGAVASTCVD